MDFSAIKKVVIPEGEVKKIARDGVTIWQSITNRIHTSIDPDGSIYNGTGYKLGYRVRSGGAEGETQGAMCTGFIKVAPGDVVRIKGWNRYTNSTASANAINAADASFANIGQASNSNYGIFADAYSAYGNASIVDGADGVSSWVVPPAASGVVYIRVSMMLDVDDPAKDAIVTINEEIV